MERSRPPGLELKVGERTVIVDLTLCNIVTSTEAMGELVFSVPYLELGRP